MSSYSVAYAKEQLSKLIDEALAGEEVVITRHGKAVVGLHSLAAREPIKKPSAELINQIAARAKKRGPLGISAVDLVRAMRDEER